jgi:DNA (cytosine-5)-methyltransferase 1
MRELALFAGVGGGILGSVLLGHRTVCAVEINKFRRNVLLQRQRDGILPWFPVWDDIRNFDGNPWRGRVDVVSGGFPCQGISAAGKGDGLADPRSGLWSEMARVVREVEPRFVFVENSPMLTTRGLWVILGNLASMGYDACWGVLGADDCGAPHHRKRIWILAHSDVNRVRLESEREQQHEAVTRDAKSVHAGATGHGSDAPMQQQQAGMGGRGPEPQTAEGHGSDTHQRRCQPEQISESGGEQRPSGHQYDGLDQEPRRPWETEPPVFRVADGLAGGLDIGIWRARIAAVGDGQVPIVAATAWVVLRKLLER